MRRTKWSIGFIAALILSLSIASYSHSNAEQSTTPTPSLADLEARVTALEAQVAALQALLGTPAVPTPSDAGNLTHTLTINLELTGVRNMGSLGFGGECWGKNGFDDIAIGSDITVTDPAGIIIATGHIMSAEVTDIEICSLSATVTNVPEVPFYQLVIGQREAPIYSLADLQANDWTISLTIGTE